jgi:hypothetical protein
MRIPIVGAAPDAGWCDPDDLWGIGFPVDSCMIVTSLQENPRTARVKAARASSRRLLEKYGIQLSTNPKTLLCFNTIQQLSCRPTKLCKELCYGWSINFQNAQSYPLFDANAKAIKKRRPARETEEIAYDIRAICNANGLDNIRWHGIGDLTPGPELAVVDALTADGAFVVWGFTRKGDVLEKLPVRDNLVFNLSVDRTMADRRLLQQARAADTHGTGLALMTEMGIAYRGRMFKRQPLAPWEKPERTARPKTKWAPGPDPLFARLAAMGLSYSVAFGYHGSNRLTRASVNDRNEPVSYPDECPATDPIGGGHFYGTCLRCGWCIRKLADKPSRNLGTHRRKYVPADDYDTTSYGEVRLEDGKQKGKPMPRRNPARDTTRDTVRTSTHWTDAMDAELSELWHLSNTALAGPGQGPSRYQRRCWAAREFHKAHPTVSTTAAYKRLERADAWRY